MKNINHIEEANSMLAVGLPESATVHALLAIAQELRAISRHLDGQAALDFMRGGV